MGKNTTHGLCFSYFAAVDSIYKQNRHANYKQYSVWILRRAEEMTLLKEKTCLYKNTTVTNEHAYLSIICLYLWTKNTGAIFSQTSAQVWSQHSPTFV